MKLTTRLNLAPRLRKSGATSLLTPAYLHGMDTDNFTFILPYGCVPCSLHYCALLPGVQIRKELKAEYYIFPNQNIFLLIFMKINL